jgi:hypothetical protein
MNSVVFLEWFENQLMAALKINLLWYHTLFPLKIWSFSDNYTYN